MRKDRLSFLRFIVMAVMAVFVIYEIWNLESPSSSTDVIRPIIHVAVLTSASVAILAYLAVYLRNRRRLVSAWPPISCSRERLRALVELSDEMERYLLSGRTSLPLVAEIWLVFISLVLGNYVINLEIRAGENLAGLILIGFLISVAPAILAIYIALAYRFSLRWRRRYESLKALRSEL